MYRIELGLRNLAVVNADFDVWDYFFELLPPIQRAIADDLTKRVFEHSHKTFKLPSPPRGAT